MLYRVELFNVGVNSFLIFNVVIFDTILVSVLSISPTIFEYLKTPVKICENLWEFRKSQEQLQKSMDI